MALRFLNGEVSELCLGKPELRWIPTTAKISDALTVLKRSTDTHHISVWSCGSGGTNSSSCVCVGKVSMADVILFLCREENLVDPIKALKKPVSDILHKGSTIVRPLDPNSSLLESIDCILEGAQNLVITTENHSISNSRKKHNYHNKPPPFTCPRHTCHEYCWLTQEDVIRFLFNSIASFSPIPTNTIESLHVIDRDVATVCYNSPASAAIHHLHRAIADQTSIAVVDESNKLIGEISPFTLSSCDETASTAILTLSAWDLMAYVDCGGPPEELVRSVRSKLEERNWKGLLELMDEFHRSSSPSNSCSSSGSSDEEWSGRVRGSGRYNPLRRSEATMCSPKSSLVAVMIQALAYRVSSVWVVEEDFTVVGSVTFAGMLKVFRSFSGGKHSKPEMESNNLFKY